MSPLDDFDEAETWVDGLFEALREEAISISHDFSAHVKRTIDLVADAQDVRPPSVTGLLVSVSLETTNIIGTAAQAMRPTPPDPEDDP